MDRKNLGEFGRSRITVTCCGNVTTGEIISDSENGDVEKEVNKRIKHS